MRQVIVPESKEHWLELRSKNISSTEVSALFGISKYATPFELWHQKKGGYVVKFDGNERTEWGNALEAAIANKVAADQSWTIRPMKEYIFDDELRIGASFDFAIGEDGILEIKNVDYLIFRDEWSVDENGVIQAPLHIEAQVQQELFCSGRQFAYIAVLIGGNRLELIKRTRDEAVIQAIKDKVAEFWRSIDANEPPPADYQADSDFIGKLFNIATPGKILNIAEDKYLTKLAVEYKELGDNIKTMTERRDAIKAEILTKVEDAEKVIGNGFSIDAGITGPAHVEYDRAAFRRFTVRFKKEKKAE